MKNQTSGFKVLFPPLNDQCEATRSSAYCGDKYLSRKEKRCTLDAAYLVDDVKYCKRHAQANALQYLLAKGTE